MLQSIHLVLLDTAHIIDTSLLQLHNMLGRITCPYFQYIGVPIGFTEYTNWEGGGGNNHMSKWYCAHFKNPFSLAIYL